MRAEITAKAAGLRMKIMPAEGGVDLVGGTLQKNVQEQIHALVSS